MLLNVLRKTPFVNSLVFFSLQSHKAALKKFITLWLLTTSPVLLAILLSPVPVGEGSIWDKFVGKMQDSMSFSEQFVYAAAFLSPVLYIIYEKYTLIEPEGTVNEKLRQTFDRVFWGYGWVSGVGLIVLFLTVVGYSAAKTNLDFFKTTFLFQIGTTLSLYFYLYALYCWYLSLLDGTGSVGNYVEANREDEAELGDQFARRLKNKDANNG